MEAIDLALKSLEGLASDLTVVDVPQSCYSGRCNLFGSACDIGREEKFIGNLVEGGK